jgi:glucose-6-phosphate dehydrogenase assembly protein OpcA
MNDVYALTEPLPVSISAIESELEAIWRGCAAHESAAVMRAAAFTLIYVVRDQGDSADVTQMLLELTQSHPSRVILLRLGNDSAEPVQEAWVTSYCHRPALGAPPVCSDYITVHSRGGRAAIVASAILPLILPGLPTLLIWDASLPAEHPLLRDLGRHVERVVVLVIPPCGPASSLSAFFALREELGDHPIVTDLAESLLRPWQQTVVALFDAEPAAAGGIREIRLLYEDSKVPVEMLLLAAWMSVVLKWQPERMVLLGSHPAIVFSGNHTIIFASGAEALEREAIEFRLIRNDAESVLRCEEPMGENRLTALLLLELDIWGRDPIREETLRRAQIWLKELLFS